MLAAGLSYRQSGPADGPVALMLHGYPESSYMWEGVMPAVAEAGWRAVAPDFAGFGDSPPDPPGTWERRVESVEGFRRERPRRLCSGAARPVPGDDGRGARRVLEGVRRRGAQPRPARNVQVGRFL